MVKQKKDKPKLESVILREVCDYLSTKDNLLFWRTNNTPIFGRNNAGQMTWRSMPRFTPKGIPDILILIKGTFIGVEIKRPKLGLRPAQAIFGERIKQNGGYYFMVTSLQEMKEII